MKSSASRSQPNPLVRHLCRALDDKKAGDLCVLDVSGLSSITDYLIIATGTSEPHLRALRVELEKLLDAAKVRILGMDTEQGSGWLVVDAFDVMVHIFTEEMRAHYRLEKLWKDAVELSVPRLLEEPKARAAAPKKPATVAKKPAAARKKSPVKRAKAPL
jgi:ribosome-associated protein